MQWLLRQLLLTCDIDNYYYIYKYSYSNMYKRTYVCKYTDIYIVRYRYTLQLHDETFFFLIETSKLG